MPGRKNIFVINGSASKNSSNEKLIRNFADLTNDNFSLTILNDLKILPHFDPEASINQPPEIISAFRENISRAEGILICSPEYIFSIPAALKNALEWCVSTTLFSDKPTGLITASAHGQKGHKQLQLIMKTLMAKFSKDTTLLIQGIKGKINEQGEITDNKTLQQLINFIDAFKMEIGI